MAMMLAIGELQRTTGPDQRVTANASLLETADSKVVNRQWMGVWRTDSLRAETASPTTPILSRLTTTIATARQDPRGRWTITLQDGAVWRQIDTEKLRRAPAPGTVAELRTAALGSYFMKIEGLGVIRAKREN
jgi:hypothetical protein